MSRTCRIGETLYRMVERSTLANDFHVMKHLRAAGLADCSPGQGEAAEDYALRLLYTVVENGAPFELLGGLLLPEGIPDEQWTAELAAATAGALRRITDPADKAEVQKLLIGLLTDFFREGLRYLKPLPIASSAPAQAEAAQPGGGSQGAKSGRA